MFGEETETQTYGTPCKRLFRRREREARGNVGPRKVLLICICCLMEETWTYFRAYGNDPFEKEQLKT